MGVRCPNGDFARPAPEIAATHIVLNGFDSLAMDVDAHIDCARRLYNCYNALAAFAATSLGLDEAFIADRLRSVRAAFGGRSDSRRRAAASTWFSPRTRGFNETLRTAIDLAAVTIS